MDSQKKEKRLNVRGVRGGVPVPQDESPVSVVRQSLGTDRSIQEYDSVGYLREADKLQMEFRRACNHKDSKLSKLYSGILIDMYSEVIGLVRNLVTENERLIGKLSVLESMNRPGTPMVVAPSYAEVVVGGEEVSREVTDNVVIVKGNREEDSEAIRRKFMGCIDPNRDLIRFQNVRKIRNGGIAVTLATKKDRDRLMIHELIQELGLNVALPVKRKPRMVIVDVSRELQGEELVKLLYGLNSDLIYGDHEGNLEDFTRDFKPLYRTGRKRELLVNWVVEVAPSLRMKLLQLSRLYLDYRCCNVRDYYEVSKCFRCQLFGHIARNCRQEKDVCYKCGVVGHRSKDCEVSERVRKCIPCERLGRRSDHFSKDRGCYSYQVAISRYKLGIDYG
ncbi:uncharacterized protein LOC111614580 [Centruroides sculpturatus]|uniref:uncharacterized protein LOC111614580 n=1 Tax=Centruroides sculpturatus TaxID=218467 RepID=UPI000C6ED695|nr:uncharacterized protein LOC111614580 [Centruroides sculpturatus]